VPSGPFYGYCRPGAKASEAVIANWWRQGMMGGKAHYECIVAFSQTDFTEDLKKITVPVLVMHSEDDRIVPYVAAGPQSTKQLKNGTLRTYKDFPTVCRRSTRTRSTQIYWRSSRANVRVLVFAVLSAFTSFCDSGH